MTSSRRAARARARTGSRSTHPIRIEPHHLEHRLVDIDACVQHLPGPPFVTEVGPRTYRGSWRPPPLHPYALREPRALAACRRDLFVDPGVRLHRVKTAR